MSCNHDHCGCDKPADPAVKATEVPHAKVMTARAEKSVILIVQEDAVAPGLERFQEPRDYRAAFLDAASARKIAAELIDFAEEAEALTPPTLTELTKVFDGDEARARDAYLRHVGPLPTPSSDASS